jgi:hypothetical protein
MEINGSALSVSSIWYNFCAWSSFFTTLFLILLYNVCNCKSLLYFWYQTLACMSCQSRGALESYKTKLNKRKKAFTTTKTRNINLQNKFNFHVSGASKRIFVTIKSTIDAVKFQIQYSYLHSNVIMCITTLLTRWRKRQSSKISHDFQPWNWYHENYSIVQSQTRDIKQLH